MADSVLGPMGAMRPAPSNAPQQDIMVTDGPPDVVKLSRKFNVPRNVLMALEERGEDPSKAAESIASAIKEGRTIEDVVPYAALVRAGDIADEIEGVEPEGGLRKAFGAGIDNLQSAYGSAMEGAGRTLGIDAVEEAGARIAEDNAAEAASKSRGLTRMEDVDGLGSGGSFVAETVAQQVPQLGSTVGPVAAGAGIGSLVAPGPGTAVGALAGGAVAFAQNLAQMYGFNRTRQKEENDGVVDEGKAFGTAIPQAGIDLASDALVLTPLGLGPKSLQAGSIASRIMKGAALGAATEAPTEAAQQAMERAQAGLSVTDEDARKEYIESAVAGGIVGGVFGGGRGAISRRADREEPVEDPLTEEAQAMIGRDDAPLALPSPTNGGMIQIGPDGDVRTEIPEALGETKPVDDGSVDGQEADGGVSSPVGADPLASANESRADEVPREGMSDLAAQATPTAPMQRTDDPKTDFSSLTLEEAQRRLKNIEDRVRVMKSTPKKLQQTMERLAEVIEDKKAGEDGVFEPVEADAEPVKPIPPSSTAATIEPIRQKAAVLRGVPKDNPPDVGRISLKWDDKEKGFIFSRKHMDKVQEAIAAREAAPVADAAKQTEKDPTPAQAEAENYKTGKADWRGLKLSVENEKGSVRSKKTPDGETAWEVTMPAHYGRILGTTGADGDHVDFYMGDDEASDKVFVVDQIDPETGRFDEHKVMLGFATNAEARKAYQAGFSDGSGASRMGAITPVKVADFIESLQKAELWKKPMAYDKKGADTRKAIDQKFEDNKKAAKSFKKGDRVTFTKDGRTKAGTITSVSSKEQGTFEVLVEGGRDGSGYDVTIGAAMLSKSDAPESVGKDDTPISPTPQNPAQKPEKPIDIKKVELKEDGGDTVAAPSPQGATTGLLSSLSEEKQARAAELKAKLAAKVRNQTSAGLDPEYITLGGELVALYIEGGAKKFGQMLRDFAESTGLSLREAQAPMRAAYNHVRDDMDLAGQDISDMDDAAAVMAEVRAALAEEQTQSKTAPTQEVKEVKVTADEDQAQDPEQTKTEKQDNTESATTQVEVGDEDASEPKTVDTPTRPSLSEIGSAWDGLSVDARSEILTDANSDDFQTLTKRGRLNAPSRRLATRDWMELTEAWQMQIADAVGVKVVTRSESDPEVKTASDAEKPMAVEGLTSYRYQGRFGPVMIGATDARDALNEVSRSIEGQPDMADLQVWDGEKYVSVDDVQEQADTAVETVKLQDSVESQREPELVNDGVSEMRDKDFVVQLLQELSSQDDFFAFPRSDATTVEGVFADIDPEVDFIGETQMPEETAEAGANERFLLRSAGRDDFYVYQNDDEVWIDVSRLEEGGGGNAIYAAIGDYAKNTDRKFIGDPAGLTDTALRRRTEAMLSSALKNGTTEHLEPHAYQLDGNVEIGVPPLNWTNGDHIGNIKALIEVSTESVTSQIREVADAEYDFNTRTFRDAEGKRLSDEALDEFRYSDKRVGAAGAGRRTLKRSILLNTLSRQEGESQPGLLELALRQSGKLVENGDLSGIMYKRPDAPTEPYEISPEAINKITESVRDELAQAGLDGKVPVEVVRALTSMATGADALGRFDPKAGISVKAGDADNAVGVMRHEIIHALRSEGFWGKPYGLFTADEWRGLVRAARADKGIAERARAQYADQPASVQTEEMVAELYRIWAARQDMSGTVGKAFSKVRDFLMALANAMRGRGFQSAGMTMDRIANGVVGGRGPDTPPGGGAALSDSTREMRAPAGAVQAKFKGLVGSDHWKDPRGFLSSKISDAMTGNGDYSLLALVPGRPLFSELGKRLISARSYLKHKEDMDQARNDWHSRADAVSQKWMSLRNKNPRANDTFMDLLHRSTLAQVDPSKDYDGSDANLAKKEVGKKGERAPEWAKKKVAQDRANRKTHASLRRIFDSLPVEFKRLYKEVGGEYSKMADDFEDAVIENVKNSMRVALKRARKDHERAMRKIKDDGLEGKERAEAIAEADEALRLAEKRNGKGAASKVMSLREKFEGNRLTGPYFPLSRFGQYFVTVRNSKGEVTSFSKFESEAEQKRHVAQMEKENPDGKVEAGVTTQKGLLRDQVNPTFVADVEQLLADADVSDELLDSIWQRWLETMPDQSIRTSKIHRKGRAGWNEDAFRAFGKHMFHGAHQLARLRYGVLLEEALDDARDEARRADNPNRAGALVNEMERRHEFTMNPTGSSVVASMSSLAFLWYLGASPAAAMVNISQTTIVGTPIMATRFSKAGVTGSLKALSDAAKDFGRGKGFAEKSEHLTDEEKAAMREAYRRGTVDKTQAHDLASVAETGIEYNAVREKWMRKIGWMFHNAERMNREVTFLANYRLARADGVDPAAAIDLAADMTWKIHFSYQNTDRPRFMQNDLGKILTTFRQFTVNMIYRMFRDAHQSLHGATEAERREARGQLVGITLSMMAHAGIKGTWGYGILMGMLALFMPGDADDLENWMQDALLMEGDDPGTAAWNFAMGAALNGAPGQIIGANLTERIGMPNLWFRGPGRELEGRDVYAHYVAELLGPVYGIGEGVVRGAFAVADGEIMRGAETMVPKFIRDPMKTTRYAVEGVETWRGDPVVENVNPWELILQANGFTPSRVAERYDINNRLKNRERKIMDERKELHNAATDALRGKEAIPEKVMDRIRDFNRRFPEYPITGDTIRRSLRGRIRASQRNESGVSINPKLNARLRSEIAPPLYN